MNTSFIVAENFDTRESPPWPPPYPELPEWTKRYADALGMWPLIDMQLRAQWDEWNHRPRDSVFVTLRQEA